ncbi:MAG: alcohol dehydrogenase catalytic domain-containing protein [Lachnospiraceae bacterium]|nr:alcohol dehydrogenase catalytic domain-containing protein [Lachnospiraceae bacterium]
MKALIVTKEHQVVLSDELPIPRIGDYEALVKNDCCMICNGTDLGVIEGAVREVERYPAVLGHEVAGRVVAVGEKVTSYKIGDLVVRAGHPGTDAIGSAWGGFAEYGVVKDYPAITRDGAGVKDASLGITQQVCPGDMRPEDASMLITLKETYSAITRIGAGGCRRMVILGDGPVALAFVSCARLQGVEEIYLFGNHREKLKTGLKLGAVSAVFNKDSGEVKAARQRLEKRVDFCIDTIGCNATIAQCIDYIHEDGTVAVYGLKNDSRLEVPFPEFRNFTIQYVQWPLPMQEALAHEPVVEAIMSGKVSAQEFITHRFSLEEFQKGFQAVRSREALKVVLYFH